MDNATAAHFRRLLIAARSCMGLDERRADPGAFTAYCHLVARTANESIAAAGYVGVEVEATDLGAGPELIAFVYGTPAVAVAL